MKIIMTKKEEDFLKSYFKGITSYLEFGCGGTILAALEFSNIKKIQTVKSDHKWISKLINYEKVLDSILEKRLLVYHANIGKIKQWGFPDNKDYGMWLNYSVKIFQRISLDIDFILIDGRFRIITFLSCLFYMKNIIIAFHDYENRKEYHICEQFGKKIYSVDSLSLFQHNANISMENFYKEMHNYVYNPS